MSHLTSIKTRFTNLFYLKKVLNKLDINYNQKQLTDQSSEKRQVDLVIPQSNNHNIEFYWNGKEYELLVDLSFWKQSSTIESFMDKIAQSYAMEHLIGESQKIDYHVTSFQKNADLSQTVVLERWMY